MAREIITSWGRVLRCEQDVVAQGSRFDALILQGSGTALPYGNGRSYGDSCLNAGGVAIKTRNGPVHRLRSCNRYSAL